jgi:hypothetical protein
MADLISRQKVLEVLKALPVTLDAEAVQRCIEAVNAMPSIIEPYKYEYHIDHTDCIWYRPEARNRCPSTCAQYRDGWNDAMNYVFRDGAGYRPYRRDKHYE